MVLTAQSMEEELDKAIAEENYDHAAQLGMDVDALRADLQAADGPELARDSGAELAALWSEKVHV